MAHRASGGSTKLGRDSKSKRLGVKLFGGQMAQAGSIIVRQRGTKFRPGKNVKRANDDSLYALKSGMVKFEKRKMILFNGKRKLRNLVSVLPRS